MLGLKAHLEKHFFSTETHFVLAMSAGRDSLFLFHQFLLWNRKFRVVHFDHKMRNESLEEANFVEQVCEKHGITHSLYQASSLAPSSNQEHWARKERYSSFFKHLQKNEVLVTAHHLQDHRETFFLQIVRSSSLYGLKGIQSYCQDRRLWRPFLELERSKIDAFLEKHNIDYCEDPSNFDVKYTRNLFRHKLLPNLSQKCLADIDSILKLSQKRKKGPVRESSNKYLFPLPDNEEAIWALQENWPVELPAFKMAWIKNLNPRIVQISIDWFLEIKNKEIELKRYKKLECIEPYEINLEGLESSTLHWQTQRINLETHEVLLGYKRVSSTLKKSKFCILVELPSKESSLCLRNRRDGDLFSPTSRVSSHRKLKKYLHEKLVDKDDRDRMPLLCSQNRVLWIPGFEKSSCLQSGPILLRIQWQKKKTVRKNKIQIME